MDFKLLILDVDGTTVEPRGDALPSRRVIEAITAAKQKISVALATGRPLPLAKPVIEALGLEGLSVVNGGAEIVNVRTGEVLHAKKIEVGALQELVELCLPFGYRLFTSEDQYGTPIKNPREAAKGAEKLFIEAVNSADAIRILEELEAVKGVAAHPTKSWTKGDVVDIHITHEEATKRFGVERLIMVMGLKKEQVIAIGDDHNDMPLMMAAGFKVAMGDAPDQVKAIADYVTTTLADDGVAQAVEELVLKAPAPSR